MLTIDFLLNGDETPSFRARRMDSGTIVLVCENERHGTERVVLHLDREQAQAIVHALMASAYPALEAVS